MDIGGFVADPIGFVTELAQLCDVPPDFGLNQALSEVLVADPDFVSHIPLVSSAGDLQLHPPCTFLRLRCTVGLPLFDEAIALRAFHDGRFYTGVVPMELPPDIEPPDRKEFPMRHCVFVSSIPSLTEWLREELAGHPGELSSRLRIADDCGASPKDLFEIPFQAIVKGLFDIPDRGNVSYDFFGFFEPPGDFAETLEIGDGFFHSLPSFLAFAALPVCSLYRPVLAAEPPAAELRRHLLGLLQTILEPLQAEMLLLWLMGRVRSHQATMAVGCFSLNFVGCGSQDAAVVIRLLTFLCTALNVVYFTIDSFNAAEFRPMRTDGEWKTSVLSASNETRLLIDETELGPGTLAKQGCVNLRTLQDIIAQQSFMVDSEGVLFDEFVSFPTIVLSQTKSLFKCQVTISIGNLTVAPQDLEPELISLLRWYVEEARFTDWTLAGEGLAFVVEQLAAMIAADHRVKTPPLLHLLMAINELNCVSLGGVEANPDIWAHALELFMAVADLSE
jgi:hypothetical protein